MKVFYHANCNDGSGAALAVWLKYGDTGHEYIPCQYGYSLPELPEGRDVVMVDFSASKEEIRSLARKAASITILDHHKTAQAELRDVDDGLGCPIDIVFDMEKSGAVLAWEYFHPGIQIPQLLLHIQDRDLWQFKIDGTREITKALMIYPEWKEWLGLSIETLKLQGKAINVFLRTQSEVITKTKPCLWDITGDMVPVYNLPGFMLSDTLHMALEKYPDAPYAVGYFDLPEGKRVYSLRSRKETNVDVSVIAKNHGGGGHKNASGFSVNLVNGK